jgi:hypothetical protein
LHKFVVVPKLDRRTHSGLDQSQPALAREFERRVWTAAAFIRLAMIRLMLGRLAETA